MFKNYSKNVTIRNKLPDFFEYLLFFQLILFVVSQGGVIDTMIASLPNQQRVQISWLLRVLCMTWISTKHTKMNKRSLGACFSVLGDAPRALWCSVTTTFLIYCSGGDCAQYLHGEVRKPDG